MGGEFRGFFFPRPSSLPNLSGVWSSCTPESGPRRPYSSGAGRTLLKGNEAMTDAMAWPNGVTAKLAELEARIEALEDEEPDDDG